MTVLVIFDPAAEERAAAQEMLADLAAVAFFHDLPAAQQVQALERAEVIVARSFAPAELPREAIGAVPRLRFVQLVYAGVDNVPFDRFPDQVVFASNAGAFAEPLAEHVLAMTLALAKNLLPAHLALARGEFGLQEMNRTLRGGACAVIGMGGNGRAVADVMRAMGMRILAVNRRGRTDAAVDFVGTPDDLPEVLAAADLVVLTVPLTRQTRNMIGERELALMKPDAMLVNVGRGAVIDQGALYRHLRRHPAFRAAIDTWWSEPGAHGAFRMDYPFFELPNLLGSPHNADDVPSIKLPAIRRALENVRRFLTGGQIVGRIDPGDYV